MSNSMTMPGLAAGAIAFVIAASACVSSTAVIGDDGTPATSDASPDTLLADGPVANDASDAAPEGSSGFCDAGLAWCANTCVSLGNDPKNCGGCGKDCGATKCIQGACQKYEALATNQQGARGIAIDDTFVYWTAQTDGKILKMPLGGGNPTVLASNQGEPYAIAVDAAYVYWTNSTAGTVMRVPIGGGSPSVVVSDPYVSANLAVDATSVYFVGGNKLMKAPKGGGSATKIADAPNGDNLLVTGSLIYFLSQPIGQIQASRVPTSGGTPTLLGTSTGSFAHHIAVDGSSVYWSDGDYVSKAPISTGPTQTLVSGFGVWAMTVDAAYVYWGEGIAVKKKPIGGGADSPVALCYGECPTSFAVNATHLYWTSYNASEIVRVPK